jgi:competence protein ComEA
MTPQEKLMVRFLMGALILGVLIGYGRKTWFKDSITIRESVEIQRAGISSVLESRGQPGTENITGPINLNTASKTELMSLPGIGPKTAENIMLFRQDHGDFQSIEDLTQVKRIGIKTLDRLREKITI